MVPVQYMICDWHKGGLKSDIVTVFFSKFKNIQKKVQIYEKNCKSTNLWWTLGFMFNMIFNKRKGLGYTSTFNV